MWKSRLNQSQKVKTDQKNSQIRFFCQKAPLGYQGNSEAKIKGKRDGKQEKQMSLKLTILSC